MRHDGRGNAYALLLFLLVAAFFGCSCKSIEARISEDSKALAAAGQEIRLASQPAIKKRDESISQQRDSNLDLTTRLKVCMEEKVEMDKAIKELSKIPCSKPSPTPSRPSP